MSRLERIRLNQIMEPTQAEIVKESGIVSEIVCIRCGDSMKVFRSNKHSPQTITGVCGKCFRFSWEKK